MIEIDESEFPLVVVRLTGDSTDAQFEAYMDGLDEIRARAKRRYVVLFDASEMLVPTGRQVRMMANWLRARTPEIRANVLADAYIIPSIALRMALKALFTLQASAIPYVVVETMAEARTVLQAYLDRDVNSVA